MDKRKIQRLPPIIVSIVVATIWLTAAAMSISGGAAMLERAEKPHTETTVATINISTTPAATKETATPPTEQPTEPETTYESVIMSRDWSGADSDMLVQIAMAEAEGESVEGKALVMLVVLNRVWSDNFPDTIEAVIFEPKQFSPVAEGGRYHTTEPNEECYEALELVMSGWDESYGALYFESCKSDSWHSENLEFLYQVGNHKFYR